LKKIEEPIKKIENDEDNLNFSEEDLMEKTKQKGEKAMSKPGENQKEFFFSQVQTEEPKRQNPNSKLNPKEGGNFLIKNDDENASKIKEEEKLSKKMERPKGMIGEDTEANQQAKRDNMKKGEENLKAQKKEEARLNFTEDQVMDLTAEKGENTQKKIEEVPEQKLKEAPQIQDKNANVTLFFLF